MLKKRTMCCNYFFFNKAIRLPIIVSLHAWLGILNLCWGSSANAQIIRDQSLGNEASKVIPKVDVKGLPAELIDGGAKRGTSLFHSFREFNIGDFQRVYFANPAGIENILTRVTGGKVSNILGTLGVNGSANLFLINPSGIMFGENARLDLGGSFVGSTADSIKFANDIEFSATNPGSLKPLLTVNVPLGLQYGKNPQRIEIKARGEPKRGITEVFEPKFGLEVPASKTLAILGGDVLLEGATLKAARGRIELGSVSGESLVSITPVEKRFCFRF